MSCEINFASGVLVDDDLVTTERFTAFAVSIADDLGLEGVRNRLGSGKQLAFSLVGKSAMSHLTNIEAIETVGLLGNAPRQNMAGYREAVVFEGELVKVTADFYDGTSRSEWGLITNVVASWGTRGRQAGKVDVVFHPADRLRFIKDSTYLTNPDLP